MSDIRSSASNGESKPRFEIVRERDMPHRQARRSTPSRVAAFFGAVRSVIEDAYVSFAQEVMVRSEQLGDARAERRHFKHLRRGERQRLRAAERPHAGKPDAQHVARPKIVR